MTEPLRGAEATPGAALRLPGPIPMLDNPAYASMQNLGVGAFVLLAVLLITRYGRGFLANISVLLGFFAGCVLAVSLGLMNFDKVAKASWFDIVKPLAFGMPTFDPVMILTMTLVMIVVMIESTGMFLALSDITGNPITQSELAAGLRTVIGGVFNTFPIPAFRRMLAWSASRVSKAAGSALPPASS